MASVKGVNIANLDAVPAVLADAAEAHGRLRVWFDSYEASALASGSDITVARLPAGATVYEAIVHHDALGANVTLQLGDAADDDRLIAATAAANAGKVVLSEDGAIDGFGHHYDAETDIRLKTGGASATGTIKCAVIYALD
ncbi:MAG TPA: hypothetical protein VFS04_00645 [Alphaproteobacteria bacterium]|nr:hypothetical protein [Alphaproteobacteria bacterium]